MSFAHQNLLRGLLAYHKQYPAHVTSSVWIQLHISSMLAENAHIFLSYK